MRTLHELPPFRDRWSYLYLEYGTLDKDAQGLCFRNAKAHAVVPIHKLSLVMLGPGTSVTHPAVREMAGHNCLLAWVGQDGVKFYAHSTGGTYSARRIIRQAWLVSDEVRRLEVAGRMYQKRFPNESTEGKSLEQLRGMEGQRVRSAYQRLAKEYGIEWHGRAFDEGNWMAATPANRALSAANSCLYGVCHAAIVSAGYSAALGFIHTGKLLSFVYDVADFYKTDVTVPLAFRLSVTEKANLERAVRMECREAFYKFGLMEKILPDIAEVFGGSDDLRASDDELEGRVISLAVGGEGGSVCGEPEPEDTGRDLDEDSIED